MLNRRILRTKVFKTLFASVFCKGSSSPLSLGDALRMLQDSCESTRDLYLFMMALIPDFARMSGIGKLQESPLVAALREDVDFQKALKKHAFSWDQYDLVFDAIVASLREKEWGKAYLESEGSSLKQDADFFCHVFEEEITGLKEVEELLEERNLYWNDDLPYSLSWCCRSLREMAAGKPWRLPELYMSDESPVAGRKETESDRDFSRRLLEFAYADYEEASAEIAACVKGWERDRLVSTDICLAVCCLAEIRHFPTIPVKVSMNEYVEISKFYGTAKSSTFVNGVLDRIVSGMKEKGEIVKAGKGLQE